VKIWIMNSRLNGPRLARLIKRLLDICSYTYQGLDGEKYAREQIQFMTERLHELSKITRDVECHKEQSALFAAVAQEQKRVTEQVSNTRAILTRSVAYWRIVEDKLSELNEQPIEGFTRFGVYIKGRFKHVADNCRMSISCQDNMVRHVDDVTDLLGARIDMNTNRALIWLSCVAAAYACTEILSPSGEVKSLSNLLGIVGERRLWIFILGIFLIRGLFRAIGFVVDQISGRWYMKKYSERL